MSDADIIGFALVSMFISSNVITYFFSRREVYNKAFNEGWKRCEKFMVKEILKVDGPEIRGLDGE